MNKEEVLKLAKLARIGVSEDEAKELVKEFDAILNYVGEVKLAQETRDKIQETKEDYPLRNVLREDTGAHEGGVYTKEVLENAPASDGDYIKVKKIL